MPSLFLGTCCWGRFVCRLLLLVILPTVFAEEAVVSTPIPLYCKPRKLHFSCPVGLHLWIFTTRITARVHETDATIGNVNWHDEPLNTNIALAIIFAEFVYCTTIRIIEMSSPCFNRFAHHREPFALRKVNHRTESAIRNIANKNQMPFLQLSFEPKKTQLHIFFRKNLLLFPALQSQGSKRSREWPLTSCGGRKPCNYWPHLNREHERLFFPKDGLKSLNMQGLRAHDVGTVLGWRGNLYTWL